MNPLLIFGQVCGDCDRRWLAITTSTQPDSACWYCGSADVKIVGRPKRWQAPATDPPDPPLQSEEDPDGPD